MNFNDMKRLMFFIQDNEYIFSSGKVEEIFYSKGIVYLYSANGVIKNLNGKYKPDPNDDEWYIQIEPKPFLNNFRKYE